MRVALAALASNSAGDSRDAKSFENSSKRAKVSGMKLQSFFEHPVLKQTAQRYLVLFNKGLRGNGQLWAVGSPTFEYDELKYTPRKTAKQLLPEWRQLASLLARRSHGFLEYDAETRTWANFHC